MPVRVGRAHYCARRPFASSRLRSVGRFLTVEGEMARSSTGKGEREGGREGERKGELRAFKREGCVERGTSPLLPPPPLLGGAPVSYMTREHT
eukprot:3414185-Pleurochrysis_carterae.AAC.1